jgi:hypothetical protein
MHLIPEGVRDDIAMVIHVVAERTATEVARPPVAHLNHHTQLLDCTIQNDEPIPIPSQTILLSTIERPPTPFVPTMEPGTEEAPIVILSDSEASPSSMNCAQQ